MRITDRHPFFSWEVPVVLRLGLIQADFSMNRKHEVNVHSPVITVSSVEIPVADLKRAIGWYEQALGYSCAWSDRHHAMLVSENKASSVNIFLVETNDAMRLEFHSTNTKVTHSAIDFKTDDLEKAHEHLARFVPGLEAIPQPANEWAPRGFGFHDCEGNRLAIFSFGKKE